MPTQLTAREFVVACELLASLYLSLGSSSALRVVADAILDHFQKVG
jgi:hypothetical protein